MQHWMFVQIPPHWRRRAGDGCHVLLSYSIDHAINRIIT